MSFQECLNKYITQIQCNGRELARNSGISETVISRYRNGERAPSADSEYLKKLADGIIKTAEEKEIRGFDGRNIFQTLRDSLETEKQGQEFNGQKLDALLKELNINISRLAAFLHYDPSYLSKLRTGKRAPAHQQEFIDKVCSYIAINYREDTDKKKVAFLTGCQEKELTETAEYKKALEDWMMSGNNIKDIDYVAGFLHKVDDFNLDEYIRAVHFDSFKVPKVPFQLPVSRHYYGLDEMREGELDFLKHTVLSKSTQNLYMCSDMPVEDMATDKEFAKKYMFGLALVLKKGLHIHIIHNIERPMKDMMLGLENWVPLYMTGRSFSFLRHSRISFFSLSDILLWFRIFSISLSDIKASGRLDNMRRRLPSFFTPSIRNLSSSFLRSALYISIRGRAFLKRNFMFFRLISTSSL